jgi:hypothetical protein
VSDLLLAENDQSIGETYEVTMSTDSQLNSERPSKRHRGCSPEKRQAPMKDGDGYDLLYSQSPPLGTQSVKLLFSDGYGSQNDAIITQLDDGVFSESYPASEWASYESDLRNTVVKHGENADDGEVCFGMVIVNPVVHNKHILLINTM